MYPEDICGWSVCPYTLVPVEAIDIVLIGGACHWIHDWGAAIDTGGFLKECGLACVPTLYLVFTAVFTLCVLVEYTELLGRTLLLPVLPKGNVGPVTLELLLDVLPEVVVFAVAGLACTLTPSLTLTVVHVVALVMVTFGFAEPSVYWPMAMLDWTALRW